MFLREVWKFADSNSDSIKSLSVGKNIELNMGNITHHIFTNKISIVIILQNLCSTYNLVFDNMPKLYLFCIYFT